MSFPPKNSFFEYRYLTTQFSQEELSKYCDRTLQRYALHTKSWSDNKNAEWMTRSYLSIKMILSATVMTNSLVYSRKKNVTIVEPYLSYYSILCCCRSLLFTLPDLNWNQGELLAVTHSKAINVTTDAFNLIDKNAAERIKQRLKVAQSLREMYSYRFPANGLSSTSEDFPIVVNEIIDFCALLCEFAQLNSDLLEASVNKNVKGNYNSDDQIYYSCFEYRFDDGKNVSVLIDNEDWYRLSRMVARAKLPHNFLSLMTQGMVEDFFFSWDPPEDNSEEDVFDMSSSLSNWHLIYPVN